MSLTTKQYNHIAKVMWADEGTGINWECMLTLEEQRAFLKRLFGWTIETVEEPDPAYKKKIRVRQIVKDAEGKVVELGFSTRYLKNIFKLVKLYHEKAIC